MKPGILTGFRLEKQYFDCIDARGNCFIIYRAELRYLFLKIHYSELIFSDSSCITTGKSSLEKTKNPRAGELIRYTCTPLEIKGSWKRIESSLPSLELITSRDRELTWNCHHPKTHTEINYKGATFTGFGYAETLLLTIKPSDLPLRGIRWGRFHSDEYTLIWINLLGAQTINKLFCNGMEFNDVHFDDESLNFDNARYRLIFRENTVIRKGKISSLFSSLPLIKIIIKKSVLNTTENKYKSKSVLMHDQKISATGWSLYEKVTWKN